MSSARMAAPSTRRRDIRGGRPPHTTPTQEALPATRRVPSCTPQSRVRVVDEDLARARSEAKIARKRLGVTVDRLPAAARHDPHDVPGLAHIRSPLLTDLTSLPPSTTSPEASKL